MVRPGNLQTKGQKEKSYFAIIRDSSKEAGQVREILLGIVTRILELLNVELKAEEVESNFLR